MKKEERKQTTVRLKIDLFKKIENDAEKESRDFTKQLEYIIIQYYEMKKILN